MLKKTILIITLIGISLGSTHQMDALSLSQKNVQEVTNISLGITALTTLKTYLFENNYTLAVFCTGMVCTAFIHKIAYSLTAKGQYESATYAVESSLQNALQNLKNNDLYIKKIDGNNLTTTLEDQLYQASAYTKKNQNPFFSTNTITIAPMWRFSFRSIDKIINSVYSFKPLCPIEEEYKIIQQQLIPNAERKIQKTIVDLDKSFINFNNAHNNFNDSCIEKKKSIAQKIEDIKGQLTTALNTIKENQIYIDTNKNKIESIFFPLIQSKKILKSASNNYFLSKKTYFTPNYYSVSNEIKIGLLSFLDYFISNTNKYIELLTYRNNEHPETPSILNQLHNLQSTAMSHKNIVLYYMLTSNH